MPLIETTGTASSRAFGQFAQRAVAGNYIEDVFSTFLYTGNGGALSITNGINLSGKGGLVWLKNRNLSGNHFLFDTIRGATKYLNCNNQFNEQNDPDTLTSFDTSGFSIGSFPDVNTNSYTYSSWSFRRQAKFFDVVVYFGDGVNGRTVSHALGSTPGFIVIKNADPAGTSNWIAWHRSAPTSYFYFELDSGINEFNTPFSSGGVYVAPNSSNFTVSDSGTVNGYGVKYVAYIFAHDAGGFGNSGLDNVISCGSYAGGTLNQTITLGYEPQFVLIKSQYGGANWQLMDSVRGMVVGQNDATLQSNLSVNETSANYISPTPTGFQLVSSSPQVNTGGTYYYMAIRRGPMRTPTSGTSVFGLSARTGTGANATVTGGQVADALLVKNRGAAVADLLASRLTGTGYLVTSSTAAEVAAGTTILQANPWDVMNGAKLGTTSTITNASTNTFINYLLSRAPGFFDVVCYTGNGSTRTIDHNLGVAPELIIVRRRSGASNWIVYSNTVGPTGYLFLNLADPSSSSVNYWNNTSPTSSVFSLSSDGTVNGNASTYTAYLFASCPGVSKIGTYSGNYGSSQIINCGFSSGARFILVKAINNYEDWYVWDSARGIISGNEPYFYLNLPNAEIGSDNFIEPNGSGFEVTSYSNINQNTVSYIYLAIA